MGHWDMDCGIPGRELRGCLDRENGVHPSLPQNSGLLHLPQAPLRTQTDTQTSLTHTLLHTFIPPLGQSPPQQHLLQPHHGACQRVPAGSPDSHLPPKPHSKAAGVNWLVSTNTLPRHLPSSPWKKPWKGLFFFSFSFFFLNQKKKPQKIIIFLIVSPNINGGTCSSDNTLKEQYRTHCLQRGNVQARGTRTRGGERGQQHTRFTLRREAGDWSPPSLWRD